MIEDIYLVVPRGKDADDPIQDSALMSRIGAKEINVGMPKFYVSEYELKNVETGTRFTFGWSSNVYNMFGLVWRIIRIK